ncbi:hypothetical protein BLNAU_15501 [Blattamonas nauphoetae]|uniref:Uncharacterized protein n=1 Tax=Blattamonas nauphoetae TaxID=2049346 RepID=A0ABQ9XCV6_9EUKA|nr:hypothetical protein BLNAU_15501 [Blattamonas nauphoetae]
MGDASGSLSNRFSNSLPADDSMTNTTFDLSNTTECHSSKELGPKLLLLEKGTHHPRREHNSTKIPHNSPHSQRRSLNFLLSFRTINLCRHKGGTRPKMHASYLLRLRTSHNPITSLHSSPDNHSPSKSTCPTQSFSLSWWQGILKQEGERGRGDGIRDEMGQG